MFVERMQFDGFDWDMGNLEKNLEKHGVTCGEIEEFFARPLILKPYLKPGLQEPRFVAVGRSDTERPLFVVFTFRLAGGSKLVRPISARYMHEKEVRAYVEAETETN